MAHLKSTLILLAIIANVYGSPSVVEVFGDVYRTCGLSMDCVKSKLVRWGRMVENDKVIEVNEDMILVKKDIAVPRSDKSDLFEALEDFIDSRDLVIRTPDAFQPDGLLGSLVPRSFQAREITVPLDATGRSKLVKKVLLPFILGLKLKTVVLVPLVIALITLKTWKAFTLGLISFVITKVLMIFKLAKPKTTYEVVHYPQYFEHHVQHPAPVAPVALNPAYSTLPVGYGRDLNAQEKAYQAYRK